MARAAVGKKLKNLRYEKNLTLKDVSEGTRISISMLSKIERDETTPTIDLVIKLALFFNLSIAEIVNIPEEKRISKTSVEKLLTMNSEGGVKVQFFNRYTPDVRADFFRIVVPPGKVLIEDAVHPAGSYHVLFCNGGKGSVVVNGEGIPVSQGDVVSFHSDVPHNYQNKGEENLILIGILTYK